jgi:hypothetical protein
MHLGYLSKFFLGFYQKVSWLVGWWVDHPAPQALKNKILCKIKKEPLFLRSAP